MRDRDLTTVQIQRNGGPNRAPTTCEDLSMNAFLSGQTRDDLTEDTIREVADAVRTRLRFLILGSSRCTLAASSRYLQTTGRGRRRWREPRPLGARATGVNLHLRLHCWDRAACERRYLWCGSRQSKKEGVARVSRRRPSALNSRSLASGDEPDHRQRRRHPSDPWVSIEAARGIHIRIAAALT